MEQRGTGPAGSGHLNPREEESDCTRFARCIRERHGAACPDYRELIDSLQRRLTLALASQCLPASSISPSRHVTAAHERVRTAVLTGIADEEFTVGYLTRTANAVVAEVLLEDLVAGNWIAWSACQLWMVRRACQELGHRPGHAVVGGSFAEHLTDVLRSVHDDRESERVYKAAYTAILGFIRHIKAGKPVQNLDALRITCVQNAVTSITRRLKHQDDAVGVANPERARLLSQLVVRLDDDDDQSISAELASAEPTPEEALLQDRNETALVEEVARFLDGITMRRGRLTTQQRAEIIVAVFLDPSRKYDDIARQYGVTRHDIDQYVLRFRKQMKRPHLRERFIRLLGQHPHDYPPATPQAGSP